MVKIPIVCIYGEIILLLPAASPPPRIARAHPAAGTLPRAIEEALKAEGITLEQMMERSHKIRENLVEEMYGLKDE